MPACVSSYTSVILCIEGLMALVSSVSIGCYNLSTSSTEYPEPWEKGFDEDILFSSECSKVSQTKDLNVKLWYYCKNLGRWLHVYKKPWVFQRPDPQEAGNKQKNSIITKLGSQQCRGNLKTDLKKNNYPSKTYITITLPIQISRIYK